MWWEEVFSPLFQSWPGSHNASSCIIDIFGIWILWDTAFLQQRMLFTIIVIHSNCWFAATFKAFSVFKAAIPFSNMTFHSLTLFVNIKMWNTSLHSVQQVMPIKARFAFSISTPSVFVLHRNIKASSRGTHYRLVLLNKPSCFQASPVPFSYAPTPKLKQFLSQFDDWWVDWIEIWNLSAICQW